jgi:hypothetical protein
MSCECILKTGEIEIADFRLPNVGLNRRAIILVDRHTGNSAMSLGVGDRDVPRRW